MESKTRISLKQRNLMKKHFNKGLVMTKKYD